MIVERLAPARDAGDRAQPPAHPRCFDGLAHDRDQPGRLERVVGAEAAGLVQHTLDHVRAAGPSVGRALAAGEREPVLGQVNTDDPLGAPQATARDRSQPDHPGTEHDAGRALADAGGVHRRTQPSRQATGEQARMVGLGVGRDLRERDLRHHGVLGEGARSHEVSDRLAVERQPGRPVRQVAEVLLLADREAQVRIRTAAVHALAALGREQRDDAVAGRDARDAVADPLDDTRALVTEHRRRVAGRVDARGGVHVRVADAARLQPDQHLSCARLREIELSDLQRLAELLEQGGADLHGGAPL